MARKQKGEEDRRRLRKALAIIASRNAPPEKRQQAVDEALELGMPLQELIEIVNERAGRAT